MFLATVDQATSMPSFSNAARFTAKGKAKGSIGVRQPVERDIGRKVRQIHAGADCTDFVAMIEVTVVQI